MNYKENIINKNIIMYYNLSQLITLSLLVKTSDIDASSNKAEYQKLVTTRFNYKTDLFPKNARKELFSKLLEQMYQDLLENDSDIKATSLGIWVEINEVTFENAIDLKILNDIKRYGDKDIEPILEFYKMTVDI